MISTIALHQLTTDRPGHFTAEASTLGFPPGCWPMQLQLIGQGIYPVQLYLDRRTSTDEVKVYASLTGTPTIDVLND
jgi:hypothetical protein